MIELKKKKIAVIGCGNMGAALVRGFVAQLVDSPQQILIYDPNNTKVANLEAITLAKPVATILEAVCEADFVFLALKPDAMLEQLREKAEIFLNSTANNPNSVIVSVAGCVSIAAIQSCLGQAHSCKNLKIVRVMPNMPIAVGHGMSGIYSKDRALSELVAQILRSVGEVLIVEKEIDLNAVTAVSGCGPAYVFSFIDAMADGGVKAGLKREVAFKLACQTVLGAAQMVIETGQHPVFLKESVATPGGITAAGLKVLEERAFRSTVIEAVETGAKIAISRER